MDLGRPRFEADRAERDVLATRFFDALRDGNVEQLRQLLAADVQAIGDSGGKAPALAKSVTGADNAARVLASIFSRLTAIDAAVQPHEINGQPGAIVHDGDGKIINTFTIDVLSGQIQAIRLMLSPDTLAHLGPVADSWAIAREAARRGKG
jgi:RNA polymerase sigma-70 factor (ECF subfamily)